MPVAFFVYLWRGKTFFVLPFLLSDGNAKLLKDAYVRGDAKIFIRQCRSFRNPLVDPWIATAIAVALLAGLDGVSDDRDREALSLLRETTSIGGCSLAWHALGTCFLYGIGTVIDRDKAMHCFQEGAARGCVFSKGMCKMYGSA